MAELNPKPLSTLIRLTLARFGDSGGAFLGSHDTEVFMMYANDVVRDVNDHPYSDDNPTIPEYTQEENKRQINNNVMVKGMLFFYSVDQNSKRSAMYREDYYRSLAQWLYEEKFGHGKIKLEAFDIENE